MLFAFLLLIFCQQQHPTTKHTKSTAAPTTAITTIHLVLKPLPLEPPDEGLLDLEAVSVGDEKVAIDGKPASACEVSIPTFEAAVPVFAAPFVTESSIRIVSDVVPHASEK